MKTNIINPNPKRSRPRWPFQRRAAAWLPTLTLCLFGFLLPARGQDPKLTNTNYPMNTNVSLGATVSFRVYANSTNLPMTYQWQHEGTTLPAGTNNPLVITNVSVADAGGYVAWITNASGNFTNSRTATLTVDTQFTKITEGAIVNDRGDFLGCAWGDYDNDGYQDLFVGNELGLTNRLYHNNRNGTFTRITAGVIVNEPADTISPVWGDFDNDGDLDLFCSNFGPPARDFFYRNEGNGSFTKITQGAWVNDSSTGAGAAWGDYDNDGFLDLFVANVDNQNDFLYHNNGDGTMTKITTGPVPNSGGISFGCVWTDYDGDGDLDLVVANYGSGQFNFQFRNNGNGTLTRITTGPLVAIGAGLLASADYDNDGDLDCLFTENASGKNEQFYRNDGPAGFVSLTTGPLVTSGGDSAGVAWGDYDNDGFLDVFVSNYLGENNFLFHNEGDGTFSRVTNGSVVNDGGLSYGCAWADYDNDGDLDLFVANNASGVAMVAGFLYRNESRTNHWMILKLAGTASNRSAIGAKVRVLATIGGRSFWQLRELSGGSGYGSQNDLRAHFGLGDATNITTLRIEWPSGNVQELVNVALNQIITVTEPTFITPARPSASLNGSLTLNRTVVSGATYQWRLDGVDLAGQTSRILNLTNVVAGQEGRYSVVVSNATTLVTNFVYLHVDTQFTKITQGAIVNDPGNSYWPAWGDYDGDGWLDLFVANGGNEGPTIPFLYRNDRQGGFVRVNSAEVGTLATDAVQACQGIWADYDNDGDQDLFIGSQVGPSRLYLNESNGRFTRVTQDVGINRALLPWTAAWADYDNDGFLDLYLASGYVSWGVRDTLWRNLGNGTFQQFLGITFPSMDVCNGTWGDADNDGDLDLLVGGFSGNNVFYRNQGNGTFTGDPSAGLGLGGGGVVQPVWADFNNDGYADVFVTRNNSPCYYFQNKKDGTFQRITTGPHAATMGLNVSAGDYDNDGDLDLFITRGQGSGDPSLVFRNEGDGTFVSIMCGSLTLDRGQFTGCAWADYDNDGALDLVVNTVANEKNALFHNNGNSNRWLIVRLVGTRSNRDGIGAKVRASATVWGRSTLQTRQIGGGTISDPRAHFGLGNATKVTTLRIEWPSGAVQEIPNVTANQVLTVYEPPAISAAVRTDGACELTIKAEPNRGWQIQASSDLLTWQTLTTVTNTSYQFQFTDPAVPGMICRFYRLQLP